MVPPVEQVLSQDTAAPFRRVFGTVGVSSIPPISGTITIGAGTINVINPPGTALEIHGSVGISAGQINIGTVDLLGAISGTVDVERIYRKSVLLDSLHIAPGSTLTSGFIDVSKERIKTVHLKSIGDLSVGRVDISLDGTSPGTVELFLEENLNPGTMRIFSFDDAVEQVRVRVENIGSVSGTVIAILGRQT